MRNISSEFREALKSDNRKYRVYASISLKDGTELNITNENLWQGGFSMEDSVSSSDSFDVGAAIVNKFTLTINNIDDSFSEYDFTDATAVVLMSIKINDEKETEKIRMCSGNISEPPKEYSSIITLSFYDNMEKFDRPYTQSKLTYPATIGSIVRDACSVCGVTLQTVSFLHDDFIIQARPNDEAITFREIISWCAQIAGCFCRCDVYGRLELKWFKYELLETQPENSTELHRISTNYQSPIVALDDIVITGVKVVEKNENDESEENLVSYQSGTDGYVISVEDNELIKNGAGQTVAGWLGEQLIGFRFRKASMVHASDPSIEAGDVGILTDRKGRDYRVLISSTQFSTGSSQKSESSAESPAINSAARYSSETKNYVDWKNGIKKEKTEREKALEELADKLGKSEGVFTTVETTPSGSKIFYLHNKPELKDSDMIWKMTAEAWGVSTDGGKTWNAGMTVDGDTIVRILNAVGINADWINAGAITVKEPDTGDIIFSVDMDTHTVIMSGDYVKIGGRPIGQALEDIKDYADKNLADYADSVSKDLSSLQSQVDGQVEDWYYDYEPSMQNYPASEWTTTEERRKHIGDRFFWKSKGYAYRFMENNGIWGWTLLQDTDITKAMQAAVNAQDTADGKRRVFVTAPKPPYDIGDLWTNGQDILTATVARAQGSVYVSSDWQKLNHYTDDTVANQALEEARKAHNIVMQLDNEYQGIPADWQGNITAFPTVQTTAQVFYGQQDVSASCSYSTNKSSGITGSWNNYLRTYTVTALSTDTGWIDITANYLGIFDVTKRFNVSKNKDGKPGRTYFIELSLQAFKRGQDGLLTPDEITARGYYREGDSPDKHSYTGRFQLQASTDGKTYTTISSSSTDVSGQRFTQLNTVSKNYIFFRVNFYHPGGFTNLIDYQTIPVLIDIAALSKDDILDLITDNGKWQGFYKGPDGNVYISFGAARGGLMKLGGVNNGNGRQEIYDNRGNLIGRLDNTGLTFYYKYSQQGQGYSYTGITLNKDGLIYVEGSYTGDVYIDTVYEYVLSFDSTQTGVDGDFKNLDAAKATIASAVLNNITKMLVSGDATFSSKPKFNNGLNVADGNVQFPGWKFNGRFLESTDGHVKIRDKDGIARLESGNFQIMYGLDLHLAGQSGSGDFGDGGNPFNIYGLGTAVGSNLVINGNSVYRSSSSKRYKTIGRNVSEEDIEKWYQIQPVWAKYKNDYVNRNSSCFNKVMPMLIAEDVETYLPTAAVKNEEGLTDDWSERILIPAMFAMIKSQKEQIDAMKKEIEEIKKIAEQSGGGMK